MAELAADINLVAEFLPQDQVPDLATAEPVDCIVICVSSVFVQAQRLFAALEVRPSLTRALVLVGGIGHSTKPLYDAVRRHKTYHPLAEEVDGLPEARVLELILRRYFNVEKITSQGCKILIEDKSTNCGSNAVETRKVLHAAGLDSLHTCMIVQDPTMSLRTVASFQKAYQDMSPTLDFIACPLLVPRVQMADQHLQYSIPGAASNELWDLHRFYELLLGEIPRLRDDANGYGPNGKGFITHVDIPDAVEAAWRRVSEALRVSR